MHTGEFFPLIEQFHTQADPSTLPELLGREVWLLRSQIEFLLEHARSSAE